MYDIMFSLFHFSVIEFTLGFGCDVPDRLDQGVRFEVERGGEGWEAIRFYTPTLMESEDSIVNVLDEEFSFVHAQAFDDNNTFLLHYINATAGPARIKEYLCGNEYADDNVRLRWMQRYAPPSLDNVSTWWLDDIQISRWDGSQLTTVMESNFTNNDINRYVSR